MLAPPQRHRERPKRPRSPSPTFEPDLASPIDVILKRRRRDELSSSSPIGSHVAHASPFAVIPNGDSEFDYFNLPHQHSGYVNGEGHHGANDQGGAATHAESSAAALRRSMAGVERRRTKQWERLNAPQSAPISYTLSQSQPTPPAAPQPSHFLTPNARGAHSQPNPMSSSPIRNVPPSSSPFRATEDTSWLSGGGGQIGPGMGIGMETATAMEAEMEELDEEEMKREWGTEYAAQNSLLHNLHLARMQGQSQTLARLDLTRSPHARGSSHTQGLPHTPSHIHPAAYSNPQIPTTNNIYSSQGTSSQQTLISTPILSSPHPQSRLHEHLQSPSHLHAHSYRQQTTSYPDSSPFSSQLIGSSNFNLHSPSVRSAMDGEGGDEEMEYLAHHDAGQGGSVYGHGYGYDNGGEDEVKRRYEEANRLLGELEVVRRRRWGEGL